MKTRTYLPLLCCSLLSCIQPFSSISQTSSHFAFNTGIGVNYMNASVAAFPGVNAAVGFTYTPVKLITLSLDGGYFYLHGKGMSSNNAALQDMLPQNEYTFHNNMFSGGGSVYLNLHELFASKNAGQPGTIPYLVAGAGRSLSYAHSETSTPTFSSHDYSLNNYYDFIGIAIRKKLMKKADILYSLRYYRTQTYYLDALPDPRRYDSYIVFTVSISNILGGAGSNKKHASSYIDWSPKSSCPSMSY